MNELVAALACPGWCRDQQRHNGHDVMVTNDGDVVLGHSGPSFGAFGCGADSDVISGELVNMCVDFDSVVLGRMGLDGTSDPAVLRRVAADALAAAEWLEANR